MSLCHLIIRKEQEKGFEKFLRRNIDYHIHSTFSDGELHPTEILKAAEGKNLKSICITDHFSLTKLALNEEELDIYFNTLENQNNSALSIFMGLEVDLSSIKDFISLTKHSWDLILFEYVFFWPDWEKKLHEVIRFKKDYFDYNIGLAHTRFTRLPESRINYVLSKITKYEIIIELNTGYKNYLDPWFGYLDETFLFSLGSDAHMEYQLGEVTAAWTYLESREIPSTCVIDLKK